ncbi:hypothetical protein [Derxia gummosa]|uniref:Uncharacterized protein n=1 Tax=Derxia gummosa DSM 723 TaxID=1121388 RepID=A0A8B6X2Z0_9BURK|nr:hypothetical protein [Derxia gummosa]
MNLHHVLAETDLVVVKGLLLVAALLALSLLGWRRALLVVVLVGAAWAAIEFQRPASAQPPISSPDRQVSMWA